jgi:glycosyltransferase involved in cell wall biosynthesis
MKVLFSCGNAPGLASGYGAQALTVLKALLEGGHEVAVLAWNFSLAAHAANAGADEVEQPTHKFMEGAPPVRTLVKEELKLPWNNVTWVCNPYATYPSPIHKRDINRILTAVGADLIVVFQDIFMWQPGHFVVPSVVWMPLHFTPVEHSTVLALSDFDVQVGISAWGSEQLRLLSEPRMHGGGPLSRCIRTIPHGRDATVFRPWTEEEDPAAKRIAVRKRLGWPLDAFVALIVASNSEESGRKALDAQLQGWARFAQARDSKKSMQRPVYVHLHTEIARAYDVGRILEVVGEFPERGRHINFRDNRARTQAPVDGSSLQGSRFGFSPAQTISNTPIEAMVDMYRAADVLLAATCSEGCGVPILEAQLCGTPVITTAATAMTEETVFGIAVPPAQWIARMDFNSGWMLPCAHGISQALAAIESWGPEDIASRRLAALPIVRAAYDESAIKDAWRALVSEIFEATKQEAGLDLPPERWLFLKAARKSAVLGRLIGQLERRAKSHSTCIGGAKERLQFLEGARSELAKFGELRQR